MLDARQLFQLGEDRWDHGHLRPRETLERLLLLLLLLRRAGRWTRLPSVQLRLLLHVLLELRDQLREPRWRRFERTRGRRLRCRRHTSELLHDLQHCRSY